MSYNKKIANEVLERVFSSKQFSSSDFDQEFLKYLVLRTLSGEIPKETTIAIDLFNKDSSFNPSSDSLVRTHIYSLRKKLEKYYLTEGRDDKVKLVIPKGRYEAIITSNDNGRVKKETKPSHSKKTFIAVGTLVGITIIFLSLTFYFYGRLSNLEGKIEKNILIDKNNPIASDFIQSDFPTLIALGDYFAFKLAEKKTEGARRIRDGAINSEADLQAYLMEYPEEMDNITERRSHYISHTIPTALNNLLPYLKLYSEHKVSVIAASDLTERHTREYNIIFIGPVKTLGVLENFLANLKYKFELHPNRIMAKNEASIYSKMTIAFPSENPGEVATSDDADYNDTYYARDFGHVVKVKGENQNTIMMICSLGDGVAKVTEKLMKQEFINEIESNFLEKDEPFPAYFESLIRFNRVEDEVYIQTIDFLKIDDNKINVTQKTATY